MLVAQLCPTVCHPMDCGPPGSSVQGILQARILEWVAIPFSKGYSWPRDQSRQILYYLSHQRSPFECQNELIEKYWWALGNRLISEMLNTLSFLGLQIFLSAITPSVFVNWQPSKLGSHFPTDTRRLGCHIFQCLHFKDMFPKSLRKTFPGF